MTELEQAALNRSASELTAIAGYAGGNTSSAACGATLCYENENATCENVLYTARDGYYENENATCESVLSTMLHTARESVTTVAWFLSHAPNPAPTRRHGARAARATGGG